MTGFVVENEDVKLVVAWNDKRDGQLPRASLTDRYLQSVAETRSTWHRRYARTHGFFPFANSKI